MPPRQTSTYELERDLIDAAKLYAAYADWYESRPVKDGFLEKDAPLMERFNAIEALMRRASSRVLLRTGERETYQKAAMKLDADSVLPKEEAEVCLPTRN